MKTPLPCCAFTRAFLIALALCLPASPPVRAEWITLQIPLTGLSNGFTFWQQGASGSAEWIWPPDSEATTAAMGYDRSQSYFRQPSGVPILEGGTFDSDGVFHPDSGSFVTISVFREGSGAFFLYNTTTLVLAPPNQTALVFADWRSLGGTAPLTFFAIDEARHGHLFAFTNGNVFIPLTSGAVQGSLGADGQFASLGFFDAWASGIALGSGSPIAVDLTAHEAVWAANPNLVGASWASDTTPRAMQTLTLTFAAAEEGHSFIIYTFAGPSQVLSPEFQGNTLAAPISIGAGTEFWVTRNNPPPQPATQHHQMPLTPLTFYVSGELPPTSGGGVTLTTLHFRISPTLNPEAFHVRRNADATSTPMVVSAANNQIPVLNPSTGQWITMPYRDAWADVNTAGGYYVTNGSGQNVGTGPGFFDFAASWYPTLVRPALVPIARQGHAMRTGEGFNATWTGAAIGQLSSGDPFSTPQWAPFIWDVATLSVPFSVDFRDSATPMVKLTDSDAGDFLQNGALGAGISGFESWHLPQPLVLKISATRWAHQLEIRCADGTIYPVTAGRIQGNWSREPLTNIEWFNPYGFFDATARCQTNIPWHLYDKTRPGFLAADGADAASFVNSTDDTDTDIDGLPDWYELMIGTNPTNPDTDGDGQTDGYEVFHNTNPLARPVTAIGATLKVYTPLE